MPAHRRAFLDNISYGFDFISLNPGNYLPPVGNVAAAREKGGPDTTNSKLIFNTNKDGIVVTRLAVRLEIIRYRRYPTRIVCHDVQLVYPVLVPSRV